ncbi:hypothetical protein DL93DRAFT_2164400 [Clavulina sp. PMI_390]|nr:hypothetical protein DL93DRAFT_2164400 [Clavulina sp. PMI_390]
MSSTYTDGGPSSMKHIDDSILLGPPCSSGSAGMAELLAKDTAEGRISFNRDDASESCFIRDATLWSKVSIGPATYYDELGLWLQRSAQALIDVTFQRLWPADQFTWMHPLLKPHMWRVRAFSTDGGVQIEDLSKLDFLSPSLKCLSLTWEGRGYEQERSPPDHLFQTHAPLHLEYLKLNTWSYTVQAVSVGKINLVNLHTLVLGDVVLVDSAFTMLQQCSNLRRLEWTLNNMSSNDYTERLERNQDSIRLPHLTTFICNGSVSQHILRILEAPSLEHLNIGSSPFTMPISKFITRHSTIKTLRLTPVKYLEGEEIRNILRNLPNLEEFVSSVWHTWGFEGLDILTLTEALSDDGEVHFKHAPKLALLGIGSDVFEDAGRQGVELVDELIQGLKAVIEQRRSGRKKFTIVLHDIPMLAPALHGRYTDTIRWINDYSFWGQDKL